MNHFETALEMEKLLKLRLKQCAKNKTEPCTMDDMELALKSLKNGTSRDHFGYPNELFKVMLQEKILRKPHLSL